MHWVVCLVRFNTCSNNKCFTSDEAQQQQINYACTWWSEQFNHLSPHSFRLLTLKTVNTHSHIMVSFSSHILYTQVSGASVPPSGSVARVSEQRLNAFSERLIKCDALLQSRSNLSSSVYTVTCLTLGCVHAGRNGNVLSPDDPPTGTFEVSERGSCGKLGRHF